jgi:hypothetical protein
MKYPIGDKVSFLNEKLSEGDADGDDTICKVKRTMVRE